MFLKKPVVLILFFICSKLATRSSAQVCTTSIRIKTRIDIALVFTRLINIREGVLIVDEIPTLIPKNRADEVSSQHNPPGHH